METETFPVRPEAISDDWPEVAAWTGSPTRTYRHPGEVLVDPRLDSLAKRALLCAWASDASAVPDQPTLRRAPGSAHTATLTEILAAIRQLDH